MISTWHHFEADHILNPDLGAINTVFDLGVKTLCIAHKTFSLSHIKVTVLWLDSIDLELYLIHFTLLLEAASASNRPLYILFIISYQNGINNTYLVGNTFP